MTSPAYRAYLELSSEARTLISASESARSPREASALAKGAAVLVAAALERYVNDFLRALCEKTQQSSWDELTEGQKQYFTFQVAEHVRPIAAKFSKKDKPPSHKVRERLRQAIAEGSAAFQTPASWKFHRDYGMFLEGAAEPERLDKALRQFLPDNRSFFEKLAERGRDRGAIATALSGLIAARHGAAHALRNSTVGPGDVKLWLRLTRVLVRDIEALLW